MRGPKSGPHAERARDCGIARSRVPCADREARGARERAVCDPLRQRRVDSTASWCSVSQALRKVPLNRRSVAAAVHKSR
eukprot:11211678-Lingulodinium_polyedra.AAC.1